MKPVFPSSTATFCTELAEDIVLQRDWLKNRKYKISVTKMEFCRKFVFSAKLCNDTFQLSYSVIN